MRARESGLNFLADTGEFNIPGLQAAFGVTDKFRGVYPNTLYAFIKAMAEGVVLARKDNALAKKAIGKYTKSDDPKYSTLPMRRMRRIGRPASPCPSK